MSLLCLIDKGLVEPSASLVFNLSVVMQLCRDFLKALATCFSEHFSKAVNRDPMVEASGPSTTTTEAASVTVRHAVVGVCCMFDFGFVSPRLFVDLIRRVAMLQDNPKENKVEKRNELPEFNVELLLLMLRLGGEKLRQDDNALFVHVWKELQSLVQPQQSGTKAKKLGQPTESLESLSACGGELRKHCLFVVL